MEQNLPELRDIHLPDAVSAFPPAYGWWVILGSILALYLLLKLGLFLRRKSKKRYALRLLQQLPHDNIVTFARQTSVILRRICVLKYNSATILYGQEWIHFLNQHCHYKLQGASAELLINAPYMETDSSVYSVKDAEQLLAFTKNWIGENL